MMAILETEISVLRFWKRYGWGRINVGESFIGWRGEMRLVVDIGMRCATMYTWKPGVWGRSQFSGVNMGCPVCWELRCCFYTSWSSEGQSRGNHGDERCKGFELDGKMLLADIGLDHHESCLAVWKLSLFQSTLLAGEMYWVAKSEF